MKKNTFILLILGLCATLCLTGCFTIDYAKVPHTEKEHLLVGNYGWYLFHYFPIVCGNVNKHSFLPCKFFRDDVTMDKIQTSFMSCANLHNKTKASDLTYTTHESVFLELPGLNIPLPIPYLITYREIQLSGIIEKEDDSK